MGVPSLCRLVAALCLGGVLSVNAVYADRPEGVGGGRPDKGAREKHRGGPHAEDRRDDHRDAPRAGGRAPVPAGGYFRDQHRLAVRDYFQEGYRSGHCPPGLAKKRNGCLPPGQAKKWATGHPLPRDLVLYDLPPDVLVRLGPPPAGHRYVRVAADILLIAIGTSMVVDAIEDLGR